MTEELQNTLIEILTYFKSGLDDVQAGTIDNERQTMQDEIDFALPLVKNLSLSGVSKSFFCQHKLVLDCKEQCFKCKKIVSEQ